MEVYKLKEEKKTQTERGNTRERKRRERGKGQQFQVCKDRPTYYKVVIQKYV